MPGPLPLKDTTVEPLQKGHLGDRKKWRLSPGRGVIWPTFFREYNMFIVQNSYWLYPKTVIQSYIITSKKYVIQKSYEAVPTGSAVRKEENEKKGKIRFKEKKNRKKCTKKTKIVMPRFELTPLNDVLKQNVKVTKPSRFATYYSPYKYRRQFVLGSSKNETQSKSDLAAINHQCTTDTDQILWPLLTLHQSLKKLAVIGRLFWQLGKRFSDRCCCREFETRANV